MHQNQAVEAPLPLVEFKAFLRKSLEDSKASMYTTWSRIRKNSQYQWEEIQDGASYLFCNPSLSSLILTGPQKSPTSFDSFDKDSSPGSEGKTQERARQLRRISRKNDRKLHVQRSSRLRRNAIPVTIKSSSIPISTSPFPCYDYVLVSFIIDTHHRSTRLHPIVDLKQVLGVLTSRSQ